MTVPGDNMHIKLQSISDGCEKCIFEWGATGRSLC